VKEFEGLDYREKYAMIQQVSSGLPYEADEGMIQNTAVTMFR